MKIEIVLSKEEPKVNAEIINNEFLTLLISSLDELIFSKGFKLIELYIQREQRYEK